MRRRRMKKSKVTTVVALITCVAVLGIGFAAFSSTISIQQKVIVTPDADTFSLAFSTASDSITDGSISPAETSGGSSASDATLSGTTISGISLKFTESGERISYRFYVINDGKYDAYLNSITIGDKTCTPKTGTTASTVETACEGITVRVNYGIGATTESGSSYLLATATKTGITGNKVNIGMYTTIYLEFLYSTSSPSDGDFSVEYGDIVFEYSTVD